MSLGVPPTSGPDPQHPSLESLELHLRHLRPPLVPEALPAKLIAAFPPLKAATSAAAGVAKSWLWAAGAAIAGVVATAVLVTWLIHANSVAPKGLGSSHVPA